MRKWMRDRLQRRKKKVDEEGTSPSPPPLQPAYFDAGEAPAKNDSPSPDEDLDLSPAQSEAEPAREEASAPEDSEQKGQPAGSPQRPRARRRRGGRGRGGRGREQAVAQAFAPATAKGVIPDGPGQAVNEAGQDGGETEPRSQPAAASKVPSIPATVPAAQRPPKGVVVLAIGLPGSGKSSWFKRHSVVPLSSDMVRSLLFDDVREQRFQDLVFSNLRSMLKARLIAKRPTNYVDATNLTPQERQHWIKLAKDYNYEVHAIFFDVPLEVCVERHQRRDRVVPEDIMRRMAAKLKAPAFDEGFAKITVVRVKKKESEPAEV